jgi:hypothetical protein
LAPGFTTPATVNVATVDAASVQLLFRVTVRISAVTVADDTAQPTPANPPVSATVGDDGRPVKDWGHWAMMVFPVVANTGFVDV